MSSKAGLVKILDSSAAGFDAEFAALTHWDLSDSGEVGQIVADILADVRNRGDDAVLEHTQRLDRFPAQSISDLLLGRDDLEAAVARLPDPQRDALQFAAQRIRRYHEAQQLPSFDFLDEHGNRLGQRVTPLERVGVYVPGGKASYPSTVLMTVIPARVAGVDEIIMAVPAPDGERSDLLLAAAAMAGADRVLLAGGAQAVGALAYGTQSVPRTDKIVGPGNAFVEAAKRQVFGTVGIDVIAGPSEIVVVSDATADPRWVAMDLFSQAEHDEDAQAILLTSDRAHCEAVHRAMTELLAQMPRKEVIEASLQKRGALICTASLEESFELVNRLAPEHLELAMEDAEQHLDKVRHAGAIFVGHFTAEALGDYVAGPSHVLPTFGTARFSSPLSVYDFLKRTSVIHCTREGAVPLATQAALLADGEGLSAHAASARYRVPGLNE